MTLEEMRAQLDALSIPHDQWQATENREVQFPRVEKYKALLVKMRTLLQEQVEADKARTAELHTVLQRAEHGGGI